MLGSGTALLELVVLVKEPEYVVEKLAPAVVANVVTKLSGVWSGMVALKEPESVPVVPPSVSVPDVGRTASVPSLGPVPAVALSVPGPV